MDTARMVTLQHAADETFPKLADDFGFDCSGPSKSGSFLIREWDGAFHKTWLFGNIMYGHSRFGRTVVPSVWTDLNCSISSSETPTGYRPEQGGAGDSVDRFRSKVA